jgi:hypothetical protein
MAWYQRSWAFATFHEIDIHLDFVAYLTDPGATAVQYHNYYKTGGSQF